MEELEDLELGSPRLNTPRQLAREPTDRAPVVLGTPGSFLEAGACAWGYFDYALNHFDDKSDKWKHCWTSCKINYYCGGEAMSVVLGAGKEGADFLCDLAGGGCKAEWADFVADMRGVACSYGTSSCASCADRSYG